MSTSPERYDSFPISRKVAWGIAGLALAIAGGQRCYSETPKAPIVRAETMYNQAIKDAVHQPDGDNCGPEIPLKFSIESAARKSLNKYDSEIDLAQRKALVIGARALHEANEPALDNNGLPTETIQVCESQVVTDAARKYINPDTGSVYIPVRKPVTQS